MVGQLIAGVLIATLMAPCFARGGHSSTSASATTSATHSSLVTGGHTIGSYTRQDGTYVAPSHATNPNATKADNYSTKGNVNPYTGKAGTRPLTPTPRTRAASNAARSLSSSASSSSLGSTRYGSSSNGIVDSGIASAMVTPSAPAGVEMPIAAYPVLQKGTIGRESYQVERLAKGDTCSTSPVGELVEKGAGFENYQVRCADGRAVRYRCEFGQCRKASS